MTVNDHLDCFEPGLVVIPCGGRKLDRRAPAGHLYVGSYHGACRRAAEALEPGRLLILSARYGLLDLDDVVEPYDPPPGAAGSITADALLEQARGRGAVVALGAPGR